MQRILFSTVCSVSELVKVMASTLAEVVDAWETKHEQRLELVSCSQVVERHVRFSFKPFPRLLPMGL